MSNESLYLTALDCATKVANLLSPNGQVTTDHLAKAEILTRLQQCALVELCYVMHGGEKGKKGD